MVLEKKSREFFAKSLKSPNDNSLAQAEWAASKEDLFQLNPIEFNVDNSYEALAIDCFERDNWVEAVSNAESWFLDSPMSRRAAVFGSHVSSVFLNDHDKSAKFCEAGLMARPNDPQLLNNLCYSLFLQNKVQEGFVELNKINFAAVKEQYVKVCLVATAGLGYFRYGLKEEGRKSYHKAIESATKLQDNYFVKIAKLNLGREELLSKTEFARSFYENEILPLQDERKEIVALKKELKVLYRHLDSD